VRRDLERRVGEADEEVDGGTSARVHPNWVEPEPKPMTLYHLDFSGRGRQF
jgi:hypothetical protein